MKSLSSPCGAADSADDMLAVVEDSPQITQNENQKADERSTTLRQFDTVDRWVSRYLHQTCDEHRFMRYR
jgi:hypothetical protein